MRWEHFYTRSTPVQDIECYPRPGIFEGPLGVATEAVFLPRRKKWEAWFHEHELAELIRCQTRLVLIRGGNHSYRGYKAYVIRESIKWFQRYLPIRRRGIRDLM